MLSTLPLNVTSSYSDVPVDWTSRISAS